MSYRKTKSGGVSEAYANFSRYDEPCKSVSIRDFSGGVSLGEQALPNAVREAINLLPSGKMLSTAPSPTEAFGGLAGGEIRGSCLSDGIWLFGKGNRLYAVKEGVLQPVGNADVLTAGSVAIYVVKDTFVVINGETVRFVDRNLSLSVPEQVPRLCFTHIAWNGTSRMEGEPPNPFCRYFEVTFDSFNTMKYTLPSDFCVDGTDIAVYDLATNEEINPSTYTFNGSFILFESVHNQPIRVRLKLANSSNSGKYSFTKFKPQRDAFASVKNPLWISIPNYGGGFLFPDPNNGKAFMLLPISDPSDFCNLSEDRLSVFAGQDTIVKLLTYRDGYLAFFRGSIKRFTLSYELETGFSLQFTTIKSDFGSDMPDSICCFDDKVIFADSSGGVYYIDRPERDGREVIRHISDNIEGSDIGFFAHSSAEYAAATAICAFGKYFLTVGNMTYVWDYTAKLPSDTQSYKNESALVWSIIDVMLPKKYLVTQAKKLYYLERATNLIRCFTDGTSFADSVSVSLITAQNDLEFDAEKLLLTLSVRYRAKDEVTVGLVYDGSAYPATYTLPPSDKPVTVTVKIPPKRFERCAAEVRSDGAITLEGLTYRYVLAK